MIEEEAKAKWCPFVRIAQVGTIAAPSYNRLEADNYQGKCIGSACMAWRWNREIVGRRSEMNSRHSEPIYGDWSTTNGYCGLAGANP